MSENENINPKQANNVEIIKKEAAERNKIRVAKEVTIKNGNKRIKKISYEKNVNGKWIKWNTKNIYLGKNKKG